MPSFRLKQRVKHVLFGTGTVLAVENDVVTVRFDNDREHPLRLSLKFEKLKPIIEDF